MGNVRVVEIGNQKHTRVICLDESTDGGVACHKYSIESLDGPGTLAAIDFQRGPVKEAGVNGCSEEDLLVILIDRLQGHQRSFYSCRENSMALERMEEALFWLNYRTANREKRGVEGTSNL